MRKQTSQEAENMLRLFRLGLRVEAIAALYHCSAWTVRQKISQVKHAQHPSR